MNTRIEPIELTDDELKAVAGGGSISFGNNNNDCKLLKYRRHRCVITV